MSDDILNELSNKTLTNYLNRNSQSHSEAYDDIYDNEKAQAAARKSETESKERARQ